MELEGRYAQEIGDELARRGHLVEWLPPVAGRADNVCGITRDAASKVLAAAAHHRSEAFAIAR